MSYSLSKLKNIKTGECVYDLSYDTADSHYLFNENKEFVRYLYTRSTPTLFAGSRFKYLPAKIPFGYHELVDAIADAIDKSEKLDGAKVVDTAEVTPTEDRLDFQKVRAEAANLWQKLVSQNEENANVILKKIEMTMGHRMKLSEFSEDQVDLLQLIVLEMREM